MLLAIAAALPSHAAVKRRRRPITPPVSHDIIATPEIDLRVGEEVTRAREILDSLNTDNILASAYVVSAVYYHDGFLATFPSDRGTADPERRIIAQVSRMITPEIKARFVGILHQMWRNSNTPGPATFNKPLLYSVLGASSRTHRYALDLFTKEGSPVHSVSRGIVVLADEGWNPDDLFSTSSRSGGNSVIIFDPDQDRFFRYCHLGVSLVARGDLVPAGDAIGYVGHSGLNASRAGHGGHLHFEANDIASGHVRALDRLQLRKLLQSFPAL